MNEKPIWLQKGPAEPYYSMHLNDLPLRQTWVEMIRKRWGKKENPGLTLFPNVARQDFIVPKTIDVDVPVVQFTPPKPSDDILVYIHGGGWVIPASGKHLAWAKRISYMANIRVVCVDYRLSPENAFPKALNDCVTAYQYARTQTKGQVFVGGDSAGGNMAAALSLYCSQYALTIPDKILCLSTFSDHYIEQYPSMQRLGMGNPYVDMSVIAFIRAFYVPSPKDWKNPYASPIYGDLSVLPPTCLVIGTDDPLCDDNLAFMNKAKKSNVVVTSLVYDNMPHSFFTYPELLPEAANDANQRIAEFLEE